MINEYHFGSIIVDDKTYGYDVEVRWDGPVLDWQRIESHRIDIDSVQRAIEQNPELIIIGTGESGVAKVLEETEEKIVSQGIGLIIKKTPEAIAIFNKKQKSGQEVIGLFHLTC